MQVTLRLAARPRSATVPALVSPGFDPSIAPDQVSISRRTGWERAVAQPAFPQMPPGAAARVPCPVRTGVYGISWVNMGVNGILTISRAVPSIDRPARCRAAAHDPPRRGCAPAPDRGLTCRSGMSGGGRAGRSEATPRRRTARGSGEPRRAARGRWRRRTTHRAKPPRSPLQGPASAVSDRPRRPRTQPRSRRFRPRRSAP